MVPFLHLELLEDIDLDTFLKEDQATLRKRGRETVSRVVGELRDYLQRECGEGEVLPDNVFPGRYVTGTCTHNFLLCFQISLKTRNPLYSVFLTFFFFFSGNQADPYWHQAAGGGKSASV